jgi:hypothetical protein
VRTVGEELHDGGLGRVRLVAAGAVASLVLLTLVVFPAVAGAALLYYKLGPDLGLGGGNSVSEPVVGAVHRRRWDPGGDVQPHGA